jgi:hypothetical protein
MGPAELFAEVARGRGHQYTTAKFWCRHRPFENIILLLRGGGDSIANNVVFSSFPAHHALNCPYSWKQKTLDGRIPLLWVSPQWRHAGLHGLVIYSPVRMAEEQDLMMPVILQYGTPYLFSG